jgi:hypothetical protein
VDQATCKEAGKSTQRTKHNTAIQPLAPIDPPEQTASLIETLEFSRCLLCDSVAGSCASKKAPKHARVKPEQQQPNNQRRHSSFQGYLQ